MYVVVIFHLSYLDPHIHLINKDAFIEGSSMINNYSFKFEHAIVPKHA